MEYFAEPTPHLVLDPFANPTDYERARFPDLEPAPGGRTGRDLYAGEPAYRSVIEKPGWAAIHARLTSEEFTREVLAAFAGDMCAAGCLVDPDAAYIDPYEETREETESRTLSYDHDPNALFHRFDFQAIDATYGKGVHVDWARRVVGGVLFCCDAEEEGMEGGSFALFEDEEFADDRFGHAPRLAKEFPVRHNFGVLFLNSNTGFHGPTRIRKIDGLRKWIYYSISSRRDVWPVRSGINSEARAALPRR